MTLTSNETAWATTIVQLIITCAFGVLITWITIKAQHAKSMEEIQEAVKNIFVRLFICFCNILAFISLCKELLSSAPLDRQGVLSIILPFVIFLVSFFGYSIQVILNMMMKHADITIRLANFFRNDTKA